MNLPLDPKSVLEAIIIDQIYEYMQKLQTPICQAPRQVFEQ